jgi:hypothetical protein
MNGALMAVESTYNLHVLLYCQAVPGFHIKFSYQVHKCNSHGRLYFFNDGVGVARGRRVGMKTR